jgi:hypothetical protein
MSSAVFNPPALVMTCMSGETRRMPLRKDCTGACRYASATVLCVRGSSLAKAAVWCDSVRWMKPHSRRISDDAQFVLRMHMTVKQ